MLIDASSNFSTSATRCSGVSNFGCLEEGFRHAPGGLVDRLDTARGTHLLRGRCGSICGAAINAAMIVAEGTESSLAGNKIGPAGLENLAAACRRFVRLPR